MSFLDAHIDRDLPSLGAGRLPPRRWRRVLRHAKGCHRCAALYEGSVRALRQLEHGSPFQPATEELEALTALNAPAALAAGGAPRRWWGPVGLGLVAAAALVVVLLPREAEFAVRGGGSPAALRVFCGGGGAALVELEEGAACGVGRALAFAVGAAPTHAQAVVQVSGSSTAAARLAVTITALPGAEEAVSLTAALERAGEVQVVAAFGPDPAQAAAAAGGASLPGTAVLRRTIRVVP